MHKKILVLVSMFVLCSCAGLFIGLDAQREFEKGLALFNAGNYEQAVPHFVKATELEPEYGNRARLGNTFPDILVFLHQQENRAHYLGEHG